ncbi:DnaJ like protein subfamily A member 5 [Angomonas deanei]|nr:DnaJ like protein subfamily A member 5 [Angomonas deanei]|eukprot:EPY39970.1 DnaJ like protein subfamily A member 5 [Angomonas deanei]
MSARTMRCYYEVLELDRKATPDDIRKAYKKMSLQYHPDRNYGNVEEADKKFKEVQNAYSILSDPNEKEWYDSHRESILRGGDGTSAPDEINLFEFFNINCFDGFGDDEQGFYAVYNRVFQTLIDEESDYNDKAKSWPLFGSSESEWSEVQAFYRHWKGFNSVKTFAWQDEYKVSEMEDRYSRRAADRINQKARATAKKEYQQNVRSLAQFIYKRDPRVQEQLEKIEEEEKAKEEARLLKEEEAFRRRREAKERIWAEAAEQEAREEEERNARGDMGDGSSLEVLYELDRAAKEARAKEMESDEDEKQQSFKCPACKKTYKSANQYKEHINSNKHKTKLKQLAAKGTDVVALMAEPKDDETKTD